MFWVRPIVRWFNSFSYLLESPCSSLLVNWKILSVATIADDRDQSSKNYETWNGLPDVAIRKIFEKFNIYDRTRMKLVSKSWNQILNRADIPTALEAPWLIASRDSCSTPQTFLTQIKIGALNATSYPIKLPKFYEDDDVPAGGCLCGTSNGWLVIAAAAGPNLKPSMFLWNPFSSTIRKLPPLSTVPFVSGLKPKLDELPSFIKRVEVFSHEYCVVAVVFSHPWGDKDDCLALCTPQERRWSIMKGNYYYSYDDILYHDGKLYALAQINDDEEEEKEEEKVIKSNYNIYLSSGSKYFEVKVCVLRLKYKLNTQKRKEYDEDEKLISRRFNITHANAFCNHLVECSTTGKLMVVTAIFDSYKYNSNGDGPVESFTCDKTSTFEVRMVENLEIVSSLGEQILFISSTGSLSVPTSAQGLLPVSNCIFFSTDDAQGLVGDQQDCVVARELGHFSMQLNVAYPGAKYLRFPVLSKTGWLKPKFV